MILNISCLPNQALDDYVQQTHRQLYDGLKHTVPLALILSDLDIPPVDKLKLHRAVLHWEQTLSLRDTDEIEKGGLRSEPFDPESNEEAEIPAQSHSVLNINEAPDGTMRVDWLFSKAAVSDDIMHDLVRIFREILNQRADKPRSTAPQKQLPEPTPEENESVLKPFAASSVFGGSN